MNVKYNIATHKKIDYVKYSLTIAFLVILASVAFAIGLHSLNVTRNRFQTEKAQLKEYEARLEKKSKDEENFKKEIETIKAQWNRRINFANTIIDLKLFPYLHRLNFIEDLLPSGVFITKLMLKADTGTVIQLNVASISTDKLMETYKAFLKYNLVISKEAQVEGLYKASLEINIANEKK
ncbi:MAG: hypothetical protein ACM3SY_02870 [Candidatus Omnitrophota bacterium]